jgi:ABC-type multidrug transport system ATPase subunit
MILIGHNGAGKSTLISYLLGFYSQIKQHPFLEHFSKLIEPLRDQKVGYAPEAALLDLSLSAYDYFLLMTTLHDVKSYDIQTELDRVKLHVDINMPIKNYSKGMKQRLLIALALVGEPDMIILDEPTSGLDPFGQAVVEELIISLKGQYKFIICTHSLPLAYHMGDEIWILQEGKIVSQYQPESLEALEKHFKQFQPKFLQ